MSSSVSKASVSKSSVSNTLVVEELTVRGHFSLQVHSLAWMTCLFSIVISCVMMPYTTRHFDNHADRILAPVLVASSSGLMLIYSTVVLFLAIKKSFTFAPLLDLVINLHLLPFTSVALGFLVWDITKFRHPGCIDTIAGRETQDQCESRVTLYRTMGGLDLGLVCLIAIMQFVMIFAAIRSVRTQFKEPELTYSGKQVV